VKSGLLIIFLTFPFLLQAKDGTDTTGRRGKQVISAALITAYGAGMTGLYGLWYKDYPQSSFHMINDNGEWLQMDKTGHAVAAYSAGYLVYKSLRETGFREKPAIWLGGGSAWIFLASVEVLDGFSSGWGFSSGDMIANTAGSALFIGQQLAWKEQRLVLKVSYHDNSLATHRPELLGSRWYEQMIKNYNGMTFWLSGSPAFFLRDQNLLPAYAGLALGYGACGMLGGRDNPQHIDGKPLPEYTRYRRFFISPDIRFRQIKTRSKTLKVLFEVLDVFKFPLPALEYDSRGQWHFHPLFF